MSKKLKIGINEGHSYEKEGKNLSKLQNHLKKGINIKLGGF